MKTSLLKATLAITILLVSLGTYAQPGGGGVGGGVGGGGAPPGGASAPIDAGALVLLVAVAVCSHRQLKSSQSHKL